LGSGGWLIGRGLLILTWHYILYVMIDGCALGSANFELSGFTKVASRASLLLSQLPNSCIPARLLSHSNFPSQLAAFQGGTSSPVVDLFLSIQWQTGGWFPWDFSIWSWQKVHLRLPTAVALQQLGPGRIRPGIQSWEFPKRSEKSWDQIIHWLPSGYVKIAIEHGHRNSGFFHETWWFSIVVLVYQRVPYPEISIFYSIHVLSSSYWDTPKLKETTIYLRPIWRSLHLRAQTLIKPQESQNWCCVYGTGKE